MSQSAIMGLKHPMVMYVYICFSIYVYLTRIHSWSITKIVLNWYTIHLDMSYQSMVYFSHTWYIYIPHVSIASRIAPLKDILAPVAWPQCIRLGYCRVFRRACIIKERVYIRSCLNQEEPMTALDGWGPSERLERLSLVLLRHLM
jgi:hypothetical protein